MLKMNKAKLLDLAKLYEGQPDDYEPTKEELASIDIEVVEPSTHEGKLYSAISEVKAEQDGKAKEDARAIEKKHKEIKKLVGDINKLIASNESYTYHKELKNPESDTRETFLVRPKCEVKFSAFRTSETPILSEEETDTTKGDE